jgi:hypothetical protein
MEMAFGTTHELRLSLEKDQAHSARPLYLGGSSYSIATMRIAGQWSLTPSMGIGLQGKQRAPPNHGCEARFPVIKQKPPAIANWRSNPTKA